MIDPASEPLETESPARATPGFAHASEAEMGRILDFYEVRWQYEPVTFPILWNLDGEVVESFSPDFYLPDLDLFLEMTTLKQRLVRKKNRKLRRLRELYPDIRIKLFYARDFRAMLLKYGRFALVDSLSGTLGQMVPDRSGKAAVPIALDVEVEVPTGIGDGIPAAEPADDLTPPAQADAAPTGPSTIQSSPSSRRTRANSRSRRRRRRSLGLGSGAFTAPAPVAADLAGRDEVAR